MDLDRSNAAAVLSRSTSAEVQAKAQELLRQEGEIYPYRLLNIYMNNPFLRLPQEDVEAMRKVAQPASLGDLVALRDAATRSRALKCCVFCMPKSGSSFIQSALQNSLQTPLVSLTSFATPLGSSTFGMNGREQELDELALIKAVLANPAGFVAQQHTRFTPFLGLQMQLYRIQPIVTVRNILDCIVSYDDMMRRWRSKMGEKHWPYDPPFALPLDFERRPEDERYTVLAHSLGVWLINFYVSWRRGVRHGYVSPLLIRYEDHVLAPVSLNDLLTRHFKLDAAQQARLAAYVERPDPDSARLNVGRKGRGEDLIPERLKAFLADYVAMFSAELSAEEMSYLVR